VHSVDRGRKHVAESLTQDDIGTHFVERDVGQQPITLSLRQAGWTVACKIGGYLVLLARGR
jgi:hypothetical protein